MDRATVGDSQKVFSVLGRGGSAVINGQGGLSWKMPSGHNDDFYVHLERQQALNQRIEHLLALNSSGS